MKHADEIVDKYLELGNLELMLRQQGRTLADGDMSQVSSDLDMLAWVLGIDRIPFETANRPAGKVPKTFDLVCKVTVAMDSEGIIYSDSCVSSEL